MDSQNAEWIRSVVFPPISFITLRKVNSFGGVQCYSLRTVRPAGRPTAPHRIHHSKGCHMSKCVPDAIQRYRPDMEYARSLVKQTGLTRQEVADTVGISSRQLYRILIGDTKMSYPIQHTLECLVMRNKPVVEFQTLSF